MGVNLSFDTYCFDQYVITANLLYGTVLGENERKNEEARTELKIGDICRLSKKKDEWVLLARMKDEHIICRDNQLIRMDYFLLKHYNRSGGFICERCLSLLSGKRRQTPAYMLGDYTACFLSEHSYSHT